MDVNGKLSYASDACERGLCTMEFLLDLVWWIPRTQGMFVAYVDGT